MSNVMECWKSIKETGGASYNMSTGTINPTIGWMVSTEGNERIVPIPETWIEFSNAVNQYFRQLSSNGKLHLDVLMENESLFLGFWIHEGKLYIDISEWYDMFTDAIEVADKNNQIAIWDCMNKKEFPLQSNLTQLINENSQK